MTASHKSANNPMNLVSKALVYFILAVWGVLVLFPMAWSVMSAFKSEAEIMTNPWALPEQWLFDNFTRAWQKASIGDYILNTLIIILPGIFFTLLLSSMAAYIFARYEFVGKKFLFTMFLIGMMFPIFLALVPLFMVLKYLGDWTGIPLLNTYHGTTLVYIAYSLSWTIFFMTGFFKTLPREIAEASVIDGASHSQTFFKVMLPLAKPGLVSAGIFNFLGQWNQFILPTVLLSSANENAEAGGRTMYVISQGLYYLQNQQRYQSDMGALFAAVAIVMVPTLVVYLIFQDRIEKGLTVGAVKG